MRPLESDVPSDPSAVPNTSPRKTHRHRRSGAVSSQDLGTLHLPAIGGSKAEHHNHSPTLGLPPTLPGLVEGQSTDTMTGPAVQIAQDDADVPITRSVGFSERVEMIPRPTSLVSTESTSSQSTIRDLKTRRLDESPSPPSLPIHQSIEPQFGTELDNLSSAATTSVSETGIDIIELDENFDEDPTAAVVTGTDNHYHLPPRDYTNPPEDSDSGSLSKTREASSDPDIDLDFASPDFEPSPQPSPVRGSSFQRARATMCSAGVPSGPAASQILGHRRTESAPSPIPVSWSLKSHQSYEKAADAGFEMEDVFEEEEEEEDEDQGSSGHAVERTDLDVSNSKTPNRNTTLTPPVREEREVRSAPSLLPAIQFHEPKIAEQKSKDTAQGDQAPLSLPRPHFVDDQSASTKSSPRYAPSGSSCEPSPRFHKSAEDVPSLISSGSTVDSTAQATLPDPSLRSLEPYFAVSQTSFGDSNKSHRKRLSVMSMSMSKLFTTNSSRTDETEETSAPRSQSTASLKPPTGNKTRRLSRMLRFWKKPPTTTT